MSTIVTDPSAYWAQAPITIIRGVGDKMSEKLKKLGISTIQDILFHLPYRYQDRTRIVPMASLRVGDHAVVEGVIRDVKIERAKRNTLVCRIADSSGYLSLRFFYYNAAQAEKLIIGKKVRCFGEVSYFRDHYQIVHPEYHLIDEHNPVAIDECLTPVYPATEGVSQLQLRRLSEQALKLCMDKGGLMDWLPLSVRQHYDLMELNAAVAEVHRPLPTVNTALFEAGQHPAQRRLAFEELVAHQLSMRQLRQRVQQYSAPPLTANQQLVTCFLAQLPFTLTNAQQRVCQEIAADLAKPSPMLRLVQGDVGSGKTVVALIAMLQAIESGYQAALMAPTEILAEQHYQFVQRYLIPLDIGIAWLSGSLTAKQKTVMLESVASGQAQCIVGTHALIQDKVAFKSLGLVVIDEQHRFGVEQRLTLRDKSLQNNLHAHQLIMTATPIPRTLAMTAYADLDCSIIDELPPGRKPIQTVVLGDSRRDEVINRLQAACEQGRQAYWICTLIEESEMIESQAAQNAAAQLMAQLPALRIGLVHGRLKPVEKEQVMQAFKAGELDILVATTVVEVGVDVPNASVMIIENPERLGLSQLHQLRGRVGRGSTASFCVLLYHGYLSEQTRTRLQVMRESQDGFVIAEQDLALRGPGELLGTKQTGLQRLKIADIIRDNELLPGVRAVADELLTYYQPHVQPLMLRWLAQDEQYAGV